MVISLSQEDQSSPHETALFTSPHFSCQKPFPTRSADMRHLPGVSVAENIPFHRQEVNWLVLPWPQKLPPKPHSRQSRKGADPTAAPKEQLTHPWALINLCVSTQEPIEAPNNSPHLREPRAAGPSDSPPRAASSSAGHRQLARNARIGSWQQSRRPLMCKTHRGEQSCHYFKERKTRLAEVTADII